jgi:hypothetical protein
VVLPSDLVQVLTLRAPPTSHAEDVGQPLSVALAKKAMSHDRDMFHKQCKGRGEKIREIQV